MILTNVASIENIFVLLLSSVLVDEVSKRKKRWVAEQTGVPRSIATLGVVGLVGAGNASATRPEGDSDDCILWNFDPDDPEQVARAYERLASLPNRKAVNGALQSLSDEQVEALAEFARRSEVVTTIELPDGSTHELHSDSTSFRVEGTDSGVSTRSAGSNTVTAISKIKNQVGGTEATLEHSVYYEYDGTSVTDVSHWHETSTGVLYYYVDSSRIISIIGVTKASLGCREVSPSV